MHRWRSMRKWRSEAYLDLYNLALGLFLVAAPWLFAFSRNATRLDAWLTGALLISISLAAVITFAEWEEWFGILLGLWMIASPWLLGFPHTAAMYISIIVGCTVAYLAALELWLIHYAQPHPAAKSTQA